MVEEKLKKWIEKKLQEGVDKQRIEESLKNTGHDPSIIEDVEDPFEEVDGSENAFKEENNDEESSDKHNNDDKEKEDKEKTEKDAGDEKTLIRTLDKIKKIRERRIAAVVGIAIIFTIAGIFTTQTDIQLTKDFTGCMNQGLYIQDLTAKDGETVADVRVSRNKSKMVLKVYKNGKVIDDSYETFIGEDTIKVESVGDKAVLKPVDCDRLNHSSEY